MPLFVTSARCRDCGTELAADAIVCPACSSIVHAARLVELQQRATSLEAAGGVTDARDAWREALALLPPDSRQHQVIRGRVDALTKQITGGAATPVGDGLSKTSKWKSGLAGIGGLLVLAATKLKFLLLGLAKAKTLFSMFAFFGVYWSIYGWPLALGLALAIYVHEMGHVFVLRSLGIGADAPLFIPGIGAMIMLREPVTDPFVDARIGLAGPIWGLGAGLAALAVYGVIRTPIWLAIAQLAGYINLFNLIPVWQLDGSRGFHALSRVQRWMAVGVIALAFVVFQQGLLLIIGAVAIYRAFQSEAGPGDDRSLVKYAGLVLSLAWLSRGLVPS
jgi:Zn-dependent protease